MFGWFGTVFGIIGAVLVAANDFREIGYIFFLIGSFFSLIAAIKEKHNANIGKIENGKTEYNRFFI